MRSELLMVWIILLYFFSRFQFENMFLGNIRLKPSDKQNELKNFFED